MIRAGSSWCDLATHPDGRVEFVHLQGTRVICELASSGAVRWARDTNQALLYLRAAADQGGRVCAIGQGHHDGQAWATVEGRQLFSLGPTHGVFPVLVHGLDEGWVCFVQHAPDEYARVVVDANGQEVERDTRAMPPTSQGFLYIASDGSPITQDLGRGAIPGLALPSPAPSDVTVWVGQSTDAPTLALFDSEAATIAFLHTPGGQPPHIIESGGTFYVCSYVAGGAWLSMHRRPFAATEPAPVDPTPVDPGEPDMSVQDVPNRVADVAAARDRYPVEWGLCHKDYPQDGSRTTRAQAELFIRLLAYDLHQQDRRFGLNGKRATDELSQDALCFRHDDGRESVVDVVNGAGGSNPSPGWNVVGHYRTAGDGQRWIKPERVSSQQPGPVPNPKPPPVTPPPAGFTFPTGVEMPEDVSLSIINFYLVGIRERDRVRGEHDTVPSRGALMYLQAVFFRELSSWILANRRAPQGVEWWGVGDRIGAAAVKHYQDRQVVD